MFLYYGESLSYTFSDYGRIINHRTSRSGAYLAQIYSSVPFVTLFDLSILPSREINY